MAATPGTAKATRTEALDERTNLAVSGADVVVVGHKPVAWRGGA